MSKSKLLNRRLPGMEGVNCLKVLQEELLKKGLRTEVPLRGLWWDFKFKKE